MSYSVFAHALWGVLLEDLVPAPAAKGIRDRVEKLYEEDEAALSDAARAEVLGMIREHAVVPIPGNAALIVPWGNADDAFDGSAHDPSELIAVGYGLAGGVPDIVEAVRAGEIPDAFVERADYISWVTGD